jgi:3-methyladenine DNA glycosylase AlkD
MYQNLISAIQKDLDDHIDDRTKNSSVRFFKEAVSFRGVKIADVNRISKKYFLHIQHKNKQSIFSICQELLKTDYGEDAFIAFDWAYRLKDKYEPEDFYVFEDWLIRYVNNWAKCDTLCNHTVGTFIDQYPQYSRRLRGWAKSENRWLRRASAVTFIIPARNGKFLTEIFGIADILLLDKDDLVQKGYGWMLKAASQAHQEEIFNYIMRNKSVMPRTALRYAIEKMPSDLKHLAMRKI